MMQRRSMAVMVALVGVLTISGTVLAGSAGWLDTSYGQRGTAALHPIAGDRRLDAVGLVRSPRGVVVLMNAQFASGGGGDEYGYYLSGLTSTLSLIHISEPTRLLSISYAVFCL